MKKLFPLLITIFFAIPLQASTIYVIDKRMWNNPTTGKTEKFPIGLFAGIEFQGKTTYKPVTPDGIITTLDSKLDAIDAIYIYEPHPLFKMFGKLPLRPVQPGVLIDGAILEVSGNISKGELTFTYYEKNKPTEKKELDSNVIKMWKESTQ